ELFAEIDVETAAAIACRRQDARLLDRYVKAVKRYVARVTSHRGIIERGALVRSTARINNAYIGPYARVDGAAVVSDSTILSSQAERAQILSGSCVTSSVLQWGSELAAGAVIDHSMLTEHCHVRRHGQVSRSILGPNTAVAGGEVTSSLVGPLVSMHHQALLI